MIPETLLQDPVVSALTAQFPSAVQSAKLAYGETTLILDPAQIVDVCRFLKTEQNFIRLSSVTAVDWYPREPRFEVVYHLQSLEKNRWLRLKCPVSGEKPEIDSVYSVWRSADWYERETFDLFGITFRNHPNLKRIMMPEGWKGHPLRKDFPIHGYKYSYAEQQ
ncbi:MAG: NADH-quinone oxidoreductase subunit C [Bryobacteraceae bacterium]|nr:NADH-quinone oxidoreductase subunit C [Bryobacteraceae bacterium]MDW8379263.1 NADH-quinone oxidoreductase subunit C [Bryobacterales bacterium]